MDETMHCIDEDVDWNHLEESMIKDLVEGEVPIASDDVLNDTLTRLNENREYYLQSKPQDHWIFPVSFEDEPLDTVEAIKDVYTELAAINKKLQTESAILHEQKLDLIERERALVECQQARSLGKDSSVRNMQKKVERRWTVMKEKQQNDLDMLTAQLLEKTKETKRMKASFDSLKQANDKLRKQLMKIQEQNRKLELQATSVQSRLANLQRKQDHADRQRELKSVTAKAKAETCQQMGTSDNVEANKTVVRTKQTTKQTAAVFDVLGILLQWLCEVHLRNVVTDNCIKQPPKALPLPALTNERCVKILPSLVEVLHGLPPGSSKMHLPCLQFIYWSLVHLDQGQLSQQPIPLSSTYRRLGEELYKPSVARFAAVVDGTQIQDSEKPKQAIFFRSPNLIVRLLSSLIILKTLSQVDCLAKVFDVLRTDLQEDSAKELFLRYQATQVVIPFLKVSNNTLMTSAVDVFLQMSMESALTQEFLESCSSDIWFRACATLLRTPSLDPKLWEKLSVILQKLSKLKTNKHHFEVQGITRIIQEVLQMKGQDNSFLSLNLRSILFNFNIPK